MLWILLFIVLILIIYILGVLSPKLIKLRNRTNELKQKETRYTNIVELSQGLICTHDLKGNILSINPSFLKILGYEKEQLLGINIRSFVVDEYKPVFSDYLERIIQNKSDHGYMKVNSADKNQSVILEYNNRLVHEKNGNDYIIGTAFDITERFINEQKLKKSEEKYRMLVENINYIVYILDFTEAKEGKMEFLSPQVKDIIGYSPVELINNPALWLETIHPDDLEQVRQETGQLMESGSSVSYTYRVRHKDTGKYIWLESKSSPRFDSNGNITGIYAVCADITARRQAERERTAAVIEGEEKERKRIAGELHDGVGQMLSAINMHLNILAPKNVAETRNKLVEITKSAIQEYRAISHNLMPPALEEQGLDVALQDICNKITGSSGIEVHFSSNGDYYDLSRSQKIEMYRISQELLSNAIRHSQADKITVSLNSQKGLIVLEVEDNGIGFNKPEVLRSAGGIGMRLLKNRAKAIGGVLKIITSKGKGTRAALILSDS